MDKVSQDKNTVEKDGVVKIRALLRSVATEKRGYCKACGGWFIVEPLVSSWSLCCVFIWVDFHGEGTCAKMKAIVMVKAKFNLSNLRQFESKLRRPKLLRIQ